MWHKLNISGKTDMFSMWGTLSGAMRKDDEAEDHISSREWTVVRTEVTLELQDTDTSPLLIRARVGC